MSTAISPFIAPKLTSEIMEILEEHRGCFQNGHTDDDVSDHLGEIRKATGLHLAVVWAFDDMWGLGGDSCLYFVDDANEERICEAPSAWYDFLFEEAANLVTMDELAAAVPGEELKGWRDLHQNNEYNFAWNVEEGEAD